MGRHGALPRLPCRAVPCQARPGQARPVCLRTGHATELRHPCWTRPRPSGVASRARCPLSSPSCHACHTHTSPTTLLPPWLQATFEDSLLDEAQAKKHCTTSEAVAAGAQAGAYRTLLTHFSQRYPKIPVVDENFQAREGAGWCLRWCSLPWPVLHACHCWQWCMRKGGGMFSGVRCWLVVDGLCTWKGCAALGLVRPCNRGKRGEAGRHAGQCDADVGEAHSPTHAPA